MKSAPTPPAAEIDIGPFTSPAASGNVMLLTFGIRYSITISLGRMHTESLRTVKLWEVRQIEAMRRAPDFPGFGATRRPLPMPSCVLCIGVAMQSFA